MDWAEEELRTINIGDKRLDRRAKQLLSRFASKPTISIPAACHGWPETKAAYRLLDNGAVTAEKILEPHRDCTLARVEGEEVVLCIEDTTELDYTDKSDIDGLGPLNYEDRQGLYLHPMLAVTPDRLCHGVLNWRTVVREPGSLGQEKDDRRPIEAKESFRWLEGYRVACGLSEGQPDTVFVYTADREADIYEIYTERYQRQVNGEASAEILIRSKHDRLLADGSKLWETVGQTAVLGEIAFELPHTNGRIGHSVVQTIQATRVVLKGPYRQGSRLADVELTAIRAREKNPPKGEQPLEWVLLTSRPAHTFEQALEILEWYLCRLQIEIYFKILKSGCKVEEFQLERLTRLEPALAFYMMVAWRVLYLTMLGRACPELSCEVVFGEQEWKAVYIVINKQPPPQQPPTLDAVIKMVSSFGGFLNRKNDGFPGPKTIWIGMQRCLDFALAIESHSEMIEQRCG